MLLCTFSLKGKGGVVLGQNLFELLLDHSYRHYLCSRQKGDAALSRNVQNQTKL